MKIKNLFLGLAFITAGNLYANRNTTDTIPAIPTDVATPESIVAALYDVISGPAGEKRNWDRMRSLFVADARMMPSGRRADGTYGRKSLTVEEYIAGSSALLEKDGFFETEIARKSEQYGGIVHVFSTYESRKKKEDITPFMRGINSFQLWNDGKRWWIISILWQGENKVEPIPQKYLNQ
jgi:hypothetical protein